MSAILRARQAGFQAYIDTPGTPHERSRAAIDTALLDLSQEVHELCLLAGGGYELIRRTSAASVPGVGTNLANAITLLRPLSERLDALDTHMSILRAQHGGTPGGGNDGGRGPSA